MVLQKMWNPVFLQAFLSKHTSAKDRSGRFHFCKVISEAMGRGGRWGGSSRGNCVCFKVDLTET